MSQLKNILGTSFLSLLLVIWGLFMVCSGRVPDVNIGYDYSGFEENNVAESKSELMTQLALLDDESTKLEDTQRSEILEALGIESNSSDMSRKEEEDFLTEELFLDLEVEIAELEGMSKKKAATIDSLRFEIQETDHQLAALRTVVKEPLQRYASKSAIAPQYTITNGSNSEYSLSYQDALDDVYSHQYVEAIGKFADLLRLNNPENLADNCQYWIGESYFALGSFELAIAEFEKVFAYDNNNKADDAQFMIGMAYMKVGETKLAKIELNNLLVFYDTSEYVTKAEKQLLDIRI